MYLTLGDIAGEDGDVVTGIALVDAPVRTGPTVFVRIIRFLVDVVFTPHKKSLTNLTSMPLTMAGVALIDTAFFQLGMFWGLLLTGLSLIAVEYLIADEAP